MDFVISFKADGERAVSDIQQIVNGVNGVTNAEIRSAKNIAQVAKWRKQTADLIAKEKEQAFKKLPIEEQMNRLIERRTQLTNLLAKAGENETRAAYLRLQLAKTQAKISGLSVGGGGADANGAAKPGMMGRLSTFVGGQVGALAAGFGAAAIAMKAKSVIDYAHEIRNMSDRVGVGVEQLQAFEFAAKQTGATLDDVAMAIKRLSVSQANAMAGNKEDIESFARMAVTLDDLKTKTPEEIFRQIAKHMEKSSLTAREMTDMIKLMGRGADSLVPAFRQGFSALVDEAKDLGLVLKEDVVDRLADAAEQAVIVSQKLLVAFGPAVANVIESLGTSVGWLLDKLQFAAAYWGAKTSSVEAFTKPDDPYNDPAAVGAAEAAVAGAPSARRRKKLPPAIPEAEPMTAHGSHSRGTIRVDDLARIGLFTGGGTDIKQQIQIQNQQLNELRALRGDVQKVERVMEDSF